MHPPTSPASKRPLLAWTLGDVAGIGPELAIKAWSDAEIHTWCRPIIIGCPDVVRRGIDLLGSKAELLACTPDNWEQAAQKSDPKHIVCLHATHVSLNNVVLGLVDPRAGQAAYDFLVQGIDLAMARKIDGLVTLPLHKEGLHAAGLPYPGHTEILAERTGTDKFGMMLYRQGLGVLHVTLHMAVVDALAALSPEAVYEKIELNNSMMQHLGIPQPRIAVAAVNPHASDGGLFGNEEEQIVRPAVERAKSAGLKVQGPIPADTLFVRASRGEFDGVVAMYHDQGHIALKLLGWREAVNITVGLPIIRTSVAHGTAYDIVGQGAADPTSLKEAVKVAAMLCQSRSEGVVR